MQTVITLAQAKQITRGRTPLVPVEYEEAIKALDACVTLDEAKYWNDKADALAAWAKIYRSKDAEIKAKRLKLHAYRRMGQLAGELRPNRTSRGYHGGSSPGPAALLRERGMSEGEAFSARRLARIPESTFKKLVDAEKVQSPQTLVGKQGDLASNWSQVRQSLQSARSVFRRFDPRGLAQGMTVKEADAARRVMGECMEWLDTFEQHLPKGPPRGGPGHG